MRRNRIHIPRHTGSRRGAWLDLASIGASFACLVHCLLPPLLLGLAPAATGMLELPESVHLLAILFALPASAFAMRMGYRRHGAALPAMLAAGGLALLALGALIGISALTETGLTMIGSLLLAAAHIGNWRLSALVSRTRSPS